MAKTASLDLVANIQHNKINFRRISGARASVVISTYPLGNAVMNSQWESHPYLGTTWRTQATGRVFTSTIADMKGIIDI